MNSPVRIMRIRTGTDGMVNVKNMEREWDQARTRLKTFNIGRALRSDLIVLTNTHNIVTAVIQPESVHRDYAWGGRESFKLEGKVIRHELIGCPDPVPNESRTRVAYNW